MKNLIAQRRYAFKTLVKTFSVLLLLCSAKAFAVPAGLTFQGRLVNNSIPVQSASVTLTLKVTSPNAAQCVLFEESHSLNMTSSDGVFTVKIGGGTRTVNDAGLSIASVFSNRSTTLNSLNCPGGGTSYTPGSGDSRNVYVTFVDGSDTVAFSTPYIIQAVPYALEADRLAGKTAAEFLQTTFDTTQSKLDGILGPTNYAELLALLSGTSTQYMTSSSTSGTSVPVLSAQPSSLTAGRMWYEGGVLKYYDGASSSVKIIGTADSSIQSGSAAGGDLTGTFPNPTLAANSVTTAKINDQAVTAAKIANTTITDAQISATAAIVDTKLATISTAGKVSGGAINSGTIGGSASVNTSGNIQTSGSLTTRNLYFYDHAGVGPGSAGIQAPISVTNYVLTLPPALPAGSNYVLASDTSGVLSWIAPSSGSVTSVTGTSPIAITGTAAAPNVTIADATTSASGVVTLAASGGTTANTVVQATDARLSDARAPSGSASGDLSGSYPGPTVAKIQSTAVSSTSPTTSGQVLRYSGSAWAPSFISMFDLRSTITGASTFGSGTTGCTAGQTLTWTAATDNLACTTIAINDGQITNNVSRAANTFLAGPDGSAGAAAYRAIASADLPSGIITAGTYKSVTVDTYGRVVAGTSPSTLSGAGITDAVVNGGQAGAVVVGPSDANSLTLNTGGSAKVTVTSGGSVGIGNTSPGAKLDIGNAGATLGTLRLEGNTSGYLQIQPSAAAGSWTMTLPSSAGTNGYVLSTNGSGVTSWVAQTAGNAGTVTSVTSANSDIGVATTTTTPVLTLNSGTGADQIVKLTAAAKYPAVDGSLITNLNATNVASGTLPVAVGGTGATTFAANAVMVTNGTGSALQALNCTNGQVITFNASGNAVCGAVSATSWVNGGNSYGAAATIGTNDAFSLGFKTNNATQMTILSTGKVGIGTATPANTLTVNGTTSATNFTSENNGFRVNSGSAGYGAIWAHSNVGNPGRLAFASGGAGFTWDTYLARSAAGELTVSSDAGTGAAVLNVRGSSYFATTSGSVGIGTASPNEKLTVAGKINGGTYSATHNNTLDLSSNNGGNADIFFTMDTGSSPVNFLVGKQNVVGSGDVFFQALPLSGGYGVLETWAGAGTVLGTGNATPILFRPNRVEKMRLDSSGNLAVGTTSAGAKLDVNQTTAGSTAIQAQNGGTAFMKIVNPAGGATNSWNAANAVQFVGMDTGTGRSINAAGTVNSGGADFAEWVDWSGPKPAMGSVVFYRGSYVVVSSPFTAAFVGNDVKDSEHAILVAFAGQLPVLVRGIVHEGDLIVAGENGEARAVRKDQATLKEAHRAVGTAWASSDDPKLKRVNVAVGIGLAGGLRDISSINQRTEKVEAENAALKAANQKLESESAAMKARLDKIEKMLNAR